MNIRKPSDYSSLYSALNVLMGSDLAETELYCEIGDMYPEFWTHKKLN